MYNNTLKNSTRRATEAELKGILPFCLPRFIKTGCRLEIITLKIYINDAQ